MQVQAASWIAVDRVKVIVNGDLAEEIKLEPMQPTVTAEPPGATAEEPSVRPVLRLDRRIPLSLTGDAWVVVLAEGDEPLSPIVVPSERPALPLAVSNPIRIRVGADAETRERWSSPWEQAQKLAASTPAELERALAADEPPEARARTLLAIAQSKRPDARHFVELGLRAPGDDARPVRLAAARAVEQLADPAFQSALDEVWPAASDDPYLRVALLRAYAAIDTEAFRDRLLAQLDADDAAALTRYGHELAPLWPDAFVRDWNVLGFFPNPSPRTLSRNNYGPELNADPARTYRGKQDQEVAWREAQTSSTGFLDLAGGASPSQSERAIAYAQVYLHSPDRRSVAFALGTDDASQVYLNGSVIYQDSTRHAANPWQHFGRLRLRRGWNRLLLKVENGVADFGLYFQLFDPQVRSAHEPD